MQKTSQQREKDLQQLRETVESHKRSAQTAVEDSERIFTELIDSTERRCSELIRLLILDIRDQEKGCNVNEDPFSSFISSDGLRESVHQLRDKLEDFCKEELKKISDRDSRQLTLDLNTAYKASVCLKATE
ncbi:hypothetical protein cypCar_00031745 [Cyprinus carpio]|nr:hypothetical protein cypCar_00031745 [Cyprinus carpio]